MSEYRSVIVTHPLSRRQLARRAAAVGVALCLPALPRGFARPALAWSPSTARAAEYHPTAEHRPVGPRGAVPEQASFIDPTAEIAGADHITLGPHVYVAPFARLLADDRYGIVIEEGTNVQDNVTIDATFKRNGADEARVKALGLHDQVEIGARVIMAHGCAVKGPAQVGIGGGPIAADPEGTQNVFLSFGCEVDGALLEMNTGVSALARVGPGVRLRSGLLVLPGKNVDTQAEADDPALGKVRAVNSDDVAFNRAVLEVNEAFAREYSRMYYENAADVLGINFAPGGAPFNPTRQLPVTAAGLRLSVPDFRNRIIYLRRQQRRLRRAVYRPRRRAATRGGRRRRGSDVHRGRRDAVARGGGIPVDCGPGRGDRKEERGDQLGPGARSDDPGSGHLPEQHGHWAGGVVT